MKKHYLVGFLIIIGALVYLGAMVFQSSLQYYVTVSEFLATPEKYRGKTLKVAGKVKDGSILKSGEGTPVIHFTITDSGGDLAVVYAGLVPDTFKAGGDVVATGKMAPDGHFQASHILAKCASKYEAKVQ